MEIQDKLVKTTSKGLKRRGRGIGSGVGGHTTGRGNKGDNSRGKTKMTFDGAKIKKGWIKRLPFLRGKNRLSNHKNINIFTLDQVDKWFKNGDIVDPSSLAKKKHISLKKLNTGVKILSTGKITKDLTFKNILLSKSASKKIITAGGKID